MKDKRASLIEIKGEEKIRFSKKLPDSQTLYKKIQSLTEENERLEKERESILQQARCWAGEAKGQRNTVNQVGSLLGGVPDWGPIVKGVDEKINRITQLEEGLEDAVRGMEWRIENEPMSIDKSDYEKLDEWKSLLNKEQ
jgi:hypothetical protein